MFKKLIPSVLFLATAVFAHGQEAVLIDNVKFSTTRNDWIQMEIQLNCRGNPSPEARNRRFVEDIKVRAYMVYTIDQAAQQFDFYISEVDIVAMEQNDKNNVYFYLPGVIAERDRLRKDPDYFFVELSVGGEVLTPQKKGMSSNITNESILTSMKSKADSEVGENEHLLMPIYLTPGDVHGRVSDLPTFLRRDVRD